MASNEPWVGVDVCQRWLAVHLRPQGTSFRGSNNERGSREVLPPLKVSGAVGCLLLESTGGYEQQVA